MKFAIMKIALIFGILSVAACGGGGSSVPPTQPSQSRTDTAKVKSYNNLLNDFQAFSNRYQVIGYTAKENIPASGTASYNGVGGYRPASTPEGTNDPIFGEALVVADFAKKTVTGNVTNFKAGSGHRTTGGNMKLEGTIDGGTIKGRLSGDINLDNKQHRFSDRAFGGFHGNNAEAIGIGGFGKNLAGEAYIASITGNKTK